MRLLLDTQVFLWWATDDHRLSARARRVLGDSASEIYFSVASGWEIAIKARLGRLLTLGEEVGSFVADQLAVNGFEVLPINLNHVLATCSLPDYHKDPFDRLLIAQAACEDLALLSADPKLARYKARVVW